MTIIFKGDILITSIGKQIIFNEFLKNELGEKIGIICQSGNSYLFTEFKLPKILYATNKYNLNSSKQ